MNVDTCPAKPVCLAPITTDILKSNRHDYLSPRLTDVSAEPAWDVNVPVIGRGFCVSGVPPLVGELCPYGRDKGVSIQEEGVVEDTPLSADGLVSSTLANPFL